MQENQQMQPPTQPLTSAEVSPKSSPSSTKNPRIFLILGLLVIVVLGAILLFGKKSDQPLLGLKLSNQTAQPKVDDSQSFVSDKLAVLTPTSAGILNTDQTTWQTVQRNGFQMQFPAQFFDESDLSLMTYYNPVDNNASHPTEDGIQFYYRFGTYGERGFRATVEAIRGEENGSEASYSEIESTTINGIEVLSFQNNTEEHPQVLYFFSLNDQKSWVRVQVDIMDPNQKGYLEVARQVINTLSLTN